MNPLAYLTYLFEQLPNIDTTDPGELDKLLPWSATLPIACRVYNNN
ncbi:IS66 C-terminal element [Desulforamulus putei DSM 12395]|uniref:IS66 C-terminal element n=1 Tax=Desulforamulus putei DSM 12395 TaxID=1121429 RepID=A0A1M5D8Y1_9FIRM|nr:IS66 C-terminal element [Desulforamulus putei DSM 12395]